MRVRELTRCSGGEHITATVVDDSGYVHHIPLSASDLELMRSREVIDFKDELLFAIRKLEYTDFNDLKRQIEDPIAQVSTRDQNRNSHQ